MGGRPRTPEPLRKIKGMDKENPSRRRPDAIEAKGLIGFAPNHLLPDEKAIWDEIVSMTHDGVLGESDRISLELMVTLLYRYRFCRIDSDVEPLIGAELNKLTSLLSLFGMTPVDRAKIVVPKGEKKNDFERVLN